MVYKPEVALKEHTHSSSDIVLDTDIIPTSDNTINIGSSEKRLASIYAEEVHVGSNTLYINDTPVLGSDTSGNTINIRADRDQSLNMQTTGVGAIAVNSEQNIDIRTTGTSNSITIVAQGDSSNVNTSATGNITNTANSHIINTASTQITEEAPNINLKGSVDVTGGLSTDALTVTGDLTVQGTQTILNTETLTVKDNIIDINKGQTGSGVSAGEAGIKIDRGDAEDYKFIFDETDDMFKMGKVGDLVTVASQDFVSSSITTAKTELEGAIVAQCKNKVDKVTGKGLSTNDFTNDYKSAIDNLPDSYARTDATKVEKSTTNGNIKINGTEATVYTHPSGTNPHGTTKSDVGLGNVPNVSTNNQTPTYTEATALAKLTSGEKLSVAFGKISKAITDLISHLGDSVKHITSAERTSWNSAKNHADSAHAPSNAQANVIESVKVNGTALTPSSKAVNVIVPTKVSQLTNDSGYKTTDTDTWRPVQDNLTSTSKIDCLSANQGKVLKGLVDGKAPSTHNHNYAGSNTPGGAANSAKMITGFTTATNSQTWGVQTGDFIAGMDAPNSGSLAFRNNCPSSGKLSQVIDGYYYQNEGQYRCLDTSDSSSFAPSSHNHNYAGSSSAGGSANSAVKLDTATAGSATQPVYFSGGKPVACTYTLGKSVPSNAKFTDTDVRNTAGSTDTSSKIFLVGATSQAANPQTYSDNQVYAQNGQLNGNTMRVAEKVTLQYNSSTQSLDFVFS